MFGPQKVKQRRNILSENISRIFMGEELEEISRSGYTEIILMPENETLDVLHSMKPKPASTPKRDHHVKRQSWVENAVIKV